MIMMNVIHSAAILVQLHAVQEEREGPGDQ